MSVKVAVTRVAASTSTGTQDITDSTLGGRTPVAVLFYAVRATSDGTATNEAVACIGAATATDERWCVSVGCEHGQGTMDTRRQTDTDECIVLLDPSDWSVEAEADLSAFIENGVRVNWTTAPASGYLITAVLFAGGGVQGHAASFQCAVEDAATDITAPGFEPDLALLVGPLTVAADGAVDHARIAFGVAANTSGTPQGGTGFFSDDNVATSDVQGIVSESYAVAHGSVTAGLEVGSFDTSGFSVTSKGADLSAYYAYYLALRLDGASVWCGPVDAPTATGVTHWGDAGFEPQFVGLWPAFLTSYDVRDSTGLAGTFGWAGLTADAQYCISISDEDGQGTSDTQCLSDNQALNVPNDDGSAGFTGTWTSMDAEGWSLNLTAVDGSACKWYAMAISVVSVGTTVGVVRCLVGDRTGRVIAELAPEVAGVAWRLNEIGRAEFALSRLADDATEDNLQFGNRVLFEFSNGLPNWGGIIDPPRNWTQEGVIECAAYSAEAILDQRLTGKSQGFEGATAGEIFETLIHYVNGVRDTGITLGDVYKGGDMHAVAYHYEYVLQVIREELCERLADADFWISAAEENGYIRFTAHFASRKGSDKSGSVVLIEGHNASEVELLEQGPIVNGWKALGGGSTWGDERLVGEDEDTTSIAKYGLREGVESYSDLATQGPLDSVADNRLAQTKEPRSRVALVAVDKAPGAFSAYAVGDSVRVLLHSYGFDQYDETVRVIAREWDGRGACALVVEEE